MEGSRNEIEVKLRCESPQAARERIARLGAVVIETRQVEDNLLFDRPDRPLEAAGETLRLRRAGLRATLTYKAPAAQAGPYKVREEHETGVDDPAALTRILAGLGFAPGWRYQKYRTVFDLRGLRICLDETPIGCFLELEGSPADIDRAAGLLGFSKEDYLRESYRDLHARAVREGHAPSGDLLLEPRQGALS